MLSKELGSMLYPILMLNVSYVLNSKVQTLACGLRKNRRAQQAFILKNFESLRKKGGILLEVHGGLNPFPPWIHALPFARSRGPPFIPLFSPAIDLGIRGSIDLGSSDPLGISMID